MKAAKKPDPEPPEQKRTRPPEPFPGFTQPRTCGNCQHFGGRGKPIRNSYMCHNGISGRLKTRAIDGCALGFYPDVEAFPLGPGAGGVFTTAGKA